MIVEYRSDCRVPSEFRIQKVPDRSSVPAVGVLEIGIEGEIPFVKTCCLEAGSLRAVEGKVEDGYIHKPDFLGVLRHKREGMLRLGACLGRRAEEEIDVGGDAGLF